ncbi:Rv3654c family TadE-like protein [Bifidobacterium canis]|uniref:Pilus assembly protein TadE n=1 Tax=Bifidobacterium canis TaxID=2610880 RepID=A0A7K1J4R1_9BIFI|nr:Rv3654c family TadE-like protein [Bifidobacterium canis]MUH59470.1 hypothetical protein [Bifidobacterium canis]
MTTSQKHASTMRWGRGSHADHSQGYGRDHERQGDEGSATVSAVALIAVVAMLMCMIAAVTCIAIAKAQARTAADLAALAAAEAYWNGTHADPCPVGAHTAQSNKASMASCAVVGTDVVIEAIVESQVPFVGAVQAQARAGPRPCSSTTMETS